MLIVLIFSILLSIGYCDIPAALQWSPSTIPGYDKEARLVLCNRPGSTSSKPLFGYRADTDTVCSAPGPTIRMQAGGRYLLWLKNAGTFGQETNIRTHGLHISGDGNADNIFRMASPGKCLGYNFTIPIDHNSGTYWYHSHIHGKTRDQVGGGALGFLFIDDANVNNGYNDIPDDVIALPNFKSFIQPENERLLFFAMGFTAVNASNVPTVNGNIAGMGTRVSVNILANQWYRFRVGFAVIIGHTTVLTTPSSCQTLLLARDGMYINSVPASSATTYTVSPASRIDLAIKCTNPSTYQLMWKVPAISQNTLVDIVVSSGQASSASPFATGGISWSPRRPVHMENTLTSSVYTSYKVQGADKAIVWGEGTSYSFDSTKPVTNLFYDKVYEFKIAHSVILLEKHHPIHLHVFPMQIVGVYGVEPPKDCANGYKVGEWYDTIETTSDCVVRFRTRGFGGATVLHCHMLVHEDSGAMIWVNVNGGPPIPTTNPPVDQVSCTF